MCSEIQRRFSPRRSHTDAVESIWDKTLVWGISPDERGDIDWLLWSIWFELLLFNGEKGDVIALGLVVDALRLRDNIVDPLGWELLILRVDGDCTKWNENRRHSQRSRLSLWCIHGELICSLGVEGEMGRLPSPTFFNPVGFDAWGTISISFSG